MVGSAAGFPRRPCTPRPARASTSFAVLEGLPEQGAADLPLALALDRAETRLLPVRLVVQRLGAGAAALNQRRARRQSHKHGKTPQPQTLRAAGSVLLLTSLDAARFPAADILALYRLRWQIELLFKRLKSLLDLDALPAKDPALAHCWIDAKLIAALLLEEMTAIVLDSPPWADANALAVADAAPAA